jgi:AcrR family transcriptional regulator
LERILDEAMRLVVEGGFDALSMHRLARALDYTPGALYRYYKSKDILISALTARVLEAFAKDLQSRLDALPADAPLLRVAACVFAYRDLARRAPNRFGMLSMLAAEPRTLVPNPEDAAPALAALMAAMTPLATALQAAGERGDLQPGEARDRALILFGATHGLLQLRKQENRVAGIEGWSRKSTAGCEARRPEGRCAGHASSIIDLDALVAHSLRTLLVGWGADPALVDPHIALASTLFGDLS